MRSLELSLEGFTSFCSHQTLDFSNLDLFAITGPTGAGKTSLLNAITFALYGHVARFGKDAKASELVNLGSQNLKVSFLFSVRGVEYRVTRTWRYRPKSPESKVLLEHFQNGNWEKVDTKEKSATRQVEQILGMDFDTFTRVILLPQGKFDEFIKGSAAKRRDILRELAGFEIFERMRQQAQKQADLLKTEYEAVERQLASLEAPTVESVTEKKEELATLEQELPTLNELVLKAQKDLDEEEKLFADITRLASLQQELASLNARGDEIENLLVRLQQAQAADQIRGKYVLAKDAKARDKQAQTAALLAQECLTKAKAELAKQKAKLDQAIAHQKIVEPQLKAREDALASAKAYEYQRQQHEAEVARARKIQAQRAETLATMVQELDNAEVRVQAASNRAEEAQKAIAEYPPGGYRLQQLTRVAPLLSQWQILHKQLLCLTRKLETATAERGNALTTYQEAASKLEKVSLALKEAHTARQAAEAANTAAFLRMSLHTGDSCPVCSGVYPEMHQLPPLLKFSGDDIASLQKREAADSESHKKAQSDMTKTETALEFCRQKESESAYALEASQTELAGVQQQISAVLQASSWEVDALNQELEVMQESDAKHHRALVEQKDAAAMLRETQQALQSARNTHATAIVESEAATKEVERWQQQLQIVELKLHELTGSQPYKTLLQALEREQQALKLQLQQATESYQPAEKSAIQSEAENKQAGDAAASTRIQNEHLQTTWEAALATAGFTEESFLLAQADSAQQASWQKAIADYSKQKVHLETLVKEVKGLIGKRTTDESTINQRRDAKRATDDHLKQAHEQGANLLAWIQVTESKQKQAEKLSADLSLYKEQAQIYYTLSRNLRSDEFQAYILEHLEAELVTRATGLLQELTDSRYTLKVQDGEYWVEDNWNGGSSRRVQTLSGGETFATSLSMALALSEKLSMGAEIGSLFLDEGFGTLDADTLESVIQILESLRQQDRLIGVITHVRDLGERLPTQVKVQKSREGSQLVVESH
jgi:exonuclease SbcC